MATLHNDQLIAAAGEIAEQIKTEVQLAISHNFPPNSENYAEIISTNPTLVAMVKELIETKTCLAEAQQWIDSEPDWKDKYMANYAALTKELEEIKDQIKAYKSWEGVICLHHNDLDRETKSGCPICLTKELDDWKGSGIRIATRLVFAGVKTDGMAEGVDALIKERDTIQTKCTELQAQIESRNARIEQIELKSQHHSEFLTARLEELEKALDKIAHIDDLAIRGNDDGPELNRRLREAVSIAETLNQIIKS